MEFVSKSIFGVFSLLGSCCVFGTLAFSSFRNQNFFNKQGGGDSYIPAKKAECRTLEDRVTSSVSYLLGLEQMPGYGITDCDKGVSEQTHQIKAVLKKEKNSNKVVNPERKIDWKKGISSLVKTAIGKIETNRVDSTWGNWQSAWSSSLQNQEVAKKSFVLTGSANDGEYLMWIDGLKNIGDASEGIILVAKKEKSENKVSVKFGWQGWKQQGYSLQIEIKKEELKDWALTVEFIKPVLTADSPEPQLR